MSVKREARIARQLARDLKQKERSARSLDIAANHVARSEYVKVAPREVRAGADPGSIFQMRMTWKVDTADRVGDWSWGVCRNWDDAQWRADVAPKLYEFGKLTWAEIERQAYGNEGKRHRSHHPMAADQICKEAQDRLLELERDYPETLFRFRLGNMPRLWGVRVVNCFEVIWHDPTHKIYPVD